MWRFLGILLIIFTLFGGNVSAQVVIRDAEIESYVRTIANPIFEAAGLTADNVQIHLIQDKRINAFVAGGQHMFIHTGLIQKAANSDVVAGVIAHEAGHIRGGHLLHKRDQAEDSLLQMTIGTVVGLAAGALAGSAEAGAAIATGAQHVATRGFLAHSRELETAADQAALELLAAVKISPVGLLGLLDSLLKIQQLQVGDIDEYAITHPASRDRMQHIIAHLQANPHLDYLERPELAAAHAMAVAKLNGFLGRPQDVIDYVSKRTTKTRADRYALAIAHYRLPDLDRAITLLDALLADEPNNAYLHELKGQIFYENGRVQDAIDAYTNAYQLNGREPLFALGLGLAYLAQGENTGIGFAEAEQYLRHMTVFEPKNAFAWQRLGVVYGRQQKLGHSYLALAESAVLKREVDQAKAYLARAARYVDEDTVLELQQRDLHHAIDQIKAKK